MRLRVILDRPDWPAALLLAASGPALAAGPATRADLPGPGLRARGRRRP